MTPRGPGQRGAEVKGSGCRREPSRSEAEFDLSPVITHTTLRGARAGEVLHQPRNPVYLQTTWSKGRVGRRGESHDIASWKTAMGQGV